MTPPDAPDRGHILWIDLDPQAGHEQAGRRPSLVLTGADYNRRSGMAVVCAITSRVKGYGFEVAIPEGLPISGVVLADQVKNLDWRARNAQFACEVPPEFVTLVLQRLWRVLTA